MVWGAISFGKKYPLVKIKDSKLTGQRYTEEILQPHLSKHLNYLQQYGQRHARVVEDGAPVHCRKCDRVVRRQLRIVSLDHPAYSPDLNPIENLWAILKRRIKRPPRIPTSEEELWEAIQQEWQAIPVSIVNKSILSMP